jgi:hypothetical protein
MWIAPEAGSMGLLTHPTTRGVGATWAAAAAQGSSKAISKRSFMSSTSLQGPVAGHRK